MTIPPYIPLSDIQWEPDRHKYQGIEALADSIANVGLIQPIILAFVGKGYKGDGPYDITLAAGGRRLSALLMLGIDRVYHAETSTIDRPGFLVKFLEPENILDILQIKLAENLDRHDKTWQEEITLLVKAWRVADAQAAEDGKRLLRASFGHMMGVDAAHVDAALMIYSDLQASPDAYDKAPNWRGALQVFLKREEEFLTKTLTTRTLAPSMVTITQQPFQKNLLETSHKNEVLQPKTIPLTSYFKNQSALDFLGSLSRNSVNHIITDPDYGIAASILSENGSADAGVAQDTVAESLSQLKSFIAASAEVLDDSGFLIFFYDLDHHNTIQGWCRDSGFSVQNWPLTWVKSDHRANGAPAFNFCKNVEWAMVCRKTRATLARVQLSSVLTLPRSDVTRTFGHPFAKPTELWKWLFQAVTHPQQIVCDPFLGSASSAVAAIEYGLNPIGCEIQTPHYNRALLNLQDAYRRVLKTPLEFV